MDDLAAFVAARLDEDEAVVAEPHIWPTTFRPERMLREVTAKRQILKRHCRLAGHNDRFFCAWCSDDTDMVSLNYAWPCPDVRDLAAVYGDHPDYRPEWKP